MNTKRESDYIALNDCPYHRILGLEIDKEMSQTSEISFRMQLNDTIARTPDRPQVHGGAMASLICTAGQTAIELQSGSSVRPVSIQIEYLRMAMGDQIVATATIRKMGRSISTVDVDVSAGNSLVAIGRSTYRRMQG